jgi:hypothetical protein
LPTWVIDLASNVRADASVALSATGSRFLAAQIRGRRVCRLHWSAVIDLASATRACPPPIGQLPAVRFGRVVRDRRLRTSAAGSDGTSAQVLWPMWSKVHMRGLCRGLSWRRLSVEKVSVLIGPGY